MAYYRICPDCGASLDPGETCDCRTEQAQREAFFEKSMELNERTGQMEFRFDREGGDYAVKTAG